MHAARGRATPPRWARGRTRAQLPLCHTICSIAAKGVAAPARTTQLQLAEQSAARGTCSGHLRHALAAIEAKATNRSGGKLQLCNQRQKHTRLPLRSSPRCSRSTLSFPEPPSLSRPGPYFTLSFRLPLCPPPRNCSCPRGRLPTHYANAMHARQRRYEPLAIKRQKTSTQGWRRRVKETLPRSPRPRSELPRF